MHLKENVNYIQFLNELQNCRKDVFFVTADGDALNLRSELTMLVFTTLTKHPDLIANATIECKDAEDYQRLKNYLA